MPGKFRRRPDRLNLCQKRLEGCSFVRISLMRNAPLMSPSSRVWLSELSSLFISSESEFTFETLNSKRIKVWYSSVGCRSTTRTLMYWSRNLYLDDGMLGFHHISTIYALLCIPEYTRVADYIFWSFAGIWKTGIGIRDLTRSTISENFLLYRLRTFVVHSDVKSTQILDDLGLKLCRLKCEFPSYGFSSPGCFQERRISLSFFVKCRTGNPSTDTQAKLIVLTGFLISGIPE